MPALTFFKCSPGGNPTLLLTDTGLSHFEQAKVAQTLLSPLHLHAEQVGFIDLGVPSLHMAGGEFCVNATRSLGAVLAMQNLLHDNQHGLLHSTVQVSGMDKAVELEIQPLKHPQQRTLDVAAIVPLAAPPCCEKLAEGFDLVHLPGIVHVLVDATRHPLATDWQQAAANIRQRFALEHYAAVGCIWWQAVGESIHMQPIVWVRELGSACFESSCGSGAMACALYLHQNQHAAAQPQGHYSLMQPSGLPLRLSCLNGPQGMAVRISGPVSILAEGTVYLDSLPLFA